MESTPSGKEYQLLSTFKDKRFNATALPQYHLSICISKESLKVSCVNLATKRCLLVEEYSLMRPHSYQRIQAIEQLYQDHSFLRAQNWTAVTLCVGNQQYTLVPQPLFQEEQLADYLRFVCPIGSNAIGHFTHLALGTTVAFAMDPWLLNWFKATYPNTPRHIIHQASSLIQGAWIYLKHNKPNRLPKVLCFVESSHLHITVIQKDALIYYNRFAYTSCDELLYYILIVMHTLQLNTSLHEVILGGAMHKHRPGYKKARRYIRKLILMNKLPYLKGSRDLSKQTMTAHWDILSTHLCHEAVQTSFLK